MKEEVMKRPSGVIAVIECFEEIPCNPCTTCCPHGAISIDGDINALPWLDRAQCVGCGLCVIACPGQAIFLQDDTASTVSVPYEMLPLPTAGQEVMLTGRMGEDIDVGVVHYVRVYKDPTEPALITLQVPAGKQREVRGFRLIKEEEHEGRTAAM